jgi:hypothetical protein
MDIHEIGYNVGCPENSNKTQKLLEYCIEFRKLTGLGLLFTSIRPISLQNEIGLEQAIGLLEQAMG